eukprot:Platyproteum_vivax@DN8698_c0_g1_i1.p1
MNSDLLGLFTGHLYFFLRETVPHDYGISLIRTPNFLIRFMDQFSGQSQNPTTRAPASWGAPSSGAGGGGDGGGGPATGNNSHYGGGAWARPSSPAAFTGTGHRLGGT